MASILNQVTRGYVGSAPADEAPQQAAGRALARGGWWVGGGGHPRLRLGSRCGAGGSSEARLAGCPSGPGLRSLCRSLAPLPCRIQRKTTSGVDRIASAPRAGSKSVRAVWRLLQGGDGVRETERS
ncbi:hypothetical protein SKAU_G00398410 [Synaphobranchus kaupii]|uniref:Uncharacterized protein n=1 Tax=Synaphobranchus kaupii TaxID=118154 RepID=A0A9Q1IC48_SYNKA|nr:hypothetical protein SKAU_G00398410 [Synaphobranchus kaupii]